MRVLYCSSMKFRHKIQEAIKRLETVGVVGLFPNLNLTASTEETATQKKRLAEDHFHAMKTADLIYFILPNGHMGTSCILELGYALGLGKNIYFSEKTGDNALDCHANSILPFNELESLAHI